MNTRKVLSFALRAVSFIAWVLFTSAVLFVVTVFMKMGMVAAGFDLRTASTASFLVHVFLLTSILWGGNFVDWVANEKTQVGNAQRDAK